MTNASIRRRPTSPPRIRRTACRSSKSISSPRNRKLPGCRSGCSTPAACHVARVRPRSLAKSWRRAELIGRSRASASGSASASSFVSRNDSEGHPGLAEAQAIGSNVPTPTAESCIARSNSRRAFGGRTHSRKNARIDQTLQRFRKTAPAEVSTRSTRRWTPSLMTAERSGEYSANRAERASAAPGAGFQRSKRKKSAVMATALRKRPGRVRRSGSSRRRKWNNALQRFAARPGPSFFAIPGHPRASGRRFPIPRVSRPTGR